MSTFCKYDTDNDGNCQYHPSGCPDLSPSSFNAAELDFKDKIQRVAYQDYYAPIESCAKLFALRRHYAEMYHESGGSNDLAGQCFENCNEQIKKTLAL